MAISKAMRERIDNLVVIYLNELESTSREAGQHQPNIIAILMEFHGDIPRSTGYDQADLKMIYEIRFLRKQHALLGEARYLFGHPFGSGEVPRDQALSLIAQRFYHDLPADRVAELLSITTDQHNGRIKKARENAANELVKIGRYEKHKAV